VVPGGFWPDAASFLAHGGGAVVERDGEVGAIAFTSYRWDDRVEIGIETLPAHRRQGLASRAAAALIERVLAAGLTPVWSCREDNTGSVRLAERLGFVPDGRWLYLHVVGSPAAG
jgi:RimJ/RimL family protein N-acetyltransferase